jgi:DNA-binding NtrC family response regulator
MPTPLKQHRVFVVDDEDVIASTMAMILRLHGGFHATSFNNPAHALEAALRDPPDLLISDVVMPALSGFELAIKIQAQCPECKVLLFSGQASTVEMLQTARLKRYNFELLLKPVHPGDLLAKIQDLTENEAPALSSQELQV